MIIRPYSLMNGRKTDNLVIQPPKPIKGELFQKLCELPGFHKWDGYSLIFRPVLANIKYIQENWPEAEWRDGTASHLEIIAKLKADADKVINFKTKALPALGSYQYKRLPREHQRRALLMSWDKPYFALLMEQRTGKTKVAIDNAAYLWKAKRLRTLIIITLNGVHRNWIENEVPEDLPDWVPRETFFTRSAFTKQHRAQFDKTVNLKDGLRIFSFNVEGLSRDGIARELFEQAMACSGPKMVAIDESSDCIKTYDAKRTKYILKATESAEFKRILTGTQTPEGRPDELFPQYLFLNENILGYDTITSFRNRYCIVVSMPVELPSGQKYERDQVMPGCKNLDELKAAIEGVSFRVRRAECMDLPAKIYKRWPVELGKEQKRLYKELEKEFITEFSGRTLTAALAMTRAIRFRQIIQGWFPMDEPELMDGETWRKVIPIYEDPLKNPKMIALLDALRTHEGKCLIWASFRPDLDLIQKVLAPYSNKAVSYHGGISSEEKAENYKRFREDPKCLWFIANPASAGRGLTMSVATQHIYYGNSLRLIDRTQSEDRAEGDESRRGGTLVIDIEAVGSYDSKIIRQLRNKKDMADLINGDPKSLFMEVEPNEEVG